MRKRNISYNLKLIAISLGMLLFTIRIQAIGSQDASVSNAEKITDSHLASEKEAESRTNTESTIESAQNGTSLVECEVSIGTLTVETQSYLFDLCKEYSIEPEVILAMCCFAN